MSSDYCANSAWCVPVNEDSLRTLGITAKFLIEDHLELEGEDKEEWSKKSIMEILSDISNNGEGIMKVSVADGTFTVEVFNYDAANGSMYDSFPEEGLYFLFFKDDLFYNNKKPLHEYLSSQNVNPEYYRWVSYG